MARRSEHSTWLRHFFYKKESWKTTWKLRFALLVLITGIPLITQRFWGLPLAQSLVCAERIPPSDALLVDNFDPYYLVFEQAEILQREGIAKRVFAHVQADGDGNANLVSQGTADIMARIARIPVIKSIPVKEIEPITLNAAKQIRDVLVRERVESVVLVSPAFRSRRSELVYQAVFAPAGITVGCSPVYGLQNPGNWWNTWHGIQDVTEQFLKLQYYRFWVLW